MNVPRETATDTRTLLSALWIVVLFAIYADMITMLTSSWLESAETYAQLFDWRALLMFSALLEIPVAMTFLAQVLSDGANRWAHTVAVPAFILFALAGGVFLYHALVRTDAFTAALQNPVALVFMVDAVVAMALLAYVFAKARVGHWGWFVALSLLGGLVFSIPAFLLLGSRGERGDPLRRSSEPRS